MTRFANNEILPPDRLWSPSGNTMTSRSLEISFDLPIVVDSLKAVQDTSFAFVVYFAEPGSSTFTIIKDADGRMMVIQYNIIC